MEDFSQGLSLQIISQSILCMNLGFSILAVYSLTQGNLKWQLCLLFLIFGVISKVPFFAFYTQGSQVKRQDSQWQKI